jgi:hypothetical protein
VPDVPQEATERARGLFEDFIEGRWEQAQGKLHGDLRGQRDVAGRMAGALADTMRPVGGFRHVGQPSARQFGDFTLVEFPLTFEAGHGLGRVALDAQGNLAGLSMQCPRRHRLDPRPVRTFLRGIPEVMDLLRTGRPRHAHVGAPQR